MHSARPVDPNSSRQHQRIPRPHSAAASNKVYKLVNHTKRYHESDRYVARTDAVQLQHACNKLRYFCVCIAAEDEEEAFEMHVEDSLALLPVLDDVALQHAKSVHSNGKLADQLSIIDVGSGGGLPGVIIAIARPHWQVAFTDCWVSVGVLKWCAPLSATLQLYTIARYFSAGTLRISCLAICDSNLDAC